MNLLFSPAPPVLRLFSILATIAVLMGLAWEKGAAHEEQKNAAMIAKQQAISIQQTASWQRKKDEALQAAAQRAEVNQAAATSARRESDSLRQQLARIKRDVPTVTRDAVDGYATDLADVFDDCQRKYQDLATDADKLASDRQTLIDAWPEPVSNP